MTIPELFFGQGTPFTNIGQLISVLLPNAIIAAGVIFFLLIIGGGISMIKNAGAEANPQAAAKAKAALTFSLIGFLLVVSAYFILQIVHIITGIDFLKPKIF